MSWEPATITCWQPRPKLIPGQHASPQSRGEKITRTLRKTAAEGRFLGSLLTLLGNYLEFESISVATPSASQPGGGCPRSHAEPGGLTNAMEL